MNPPTPIPLQTHPDPSSSSSSSSGASPSVVEADQATEAEEERRRSEDALINWMAAIDYFHCRRAHQVPYKPEVPCISHLSIYHPHQQRHQPSLIAHYQCIASSVCDEVGILWRFYVTSAGHSHSTS
jgi:hypothetical protein